MQIQHFDQDPTVLAVLRWRADSATLAQLQPVLERLRTIPDRGCLSGAVPYSCAREHVGLCGPCVIRDIRAALFGDLEEEEA